MANLQCSSCHDPLLFEVEPDSEQEDTKASAAHESIPDDVELSCGCHFHWECFLEAYNLTECPSCSKNISSLSGCGRQQVLCTVRNEGGVQEQYDILPSATEEAYLRTFPDERMPHAFLSFCREGDIDAIIHIIKDEDDLGDSEEEAGAESVPDILRYVGTFEGIDGSGLHVAIRYGREDIAWLLLALVSTLDWTKFPPAVLHAMESFDLSPRDRTKGVDIRGLKDSEGRTPKTLAAQIGGNWRTWIDDGRFDT